MLGVYRAGGFRFALDDVGGGHSTLEVLTAANPEYIKVARQPGVQRRGRRTAESVA